MIYWFCLGLFIFASVCISHQKREDELKKQIKELQEQLKLKS